MAFSLHGGQLCPGIGQYIHANAARPSLITLTIIEHMLAIDLSH